MEHINTHSVEQYQTAIRLWLHETGYSLRDANRITGLANGTLNKILNGQTTKVSINLKVRLAPHLKFYDTEELPKVKTYELEIPESLVAYSYQQKLVLEEQLKAMAKLCDLSNPS